MTNIIAWSITGALGGVLFIVVTLWLETRPAIAIKHAESDSQ